MNLIPGTQDEYTMEGSLAEIFFVLQVQTVSYFKQVVNYSLPSRMFLTFPIPLKNHLMDSGALSKQMEAGMA